MSRFFTRAGTSRFACSLLVFTIVAACGGSVPGAGTSGTPAGSSSGPNQPLATSVGAVGALAEMCSLISGEDIAMIVDKDLDATQPGADGWCTWTFTDRRPGAIAGIGGSVIVRYEDDDVTLGIQKGAFPGGEDVSIGDRGYWTDDLSVLYVAKGAHVYAVQLILFDRTDAQGHGDRNRATAPRQSLIGSPRQSHARRTTAMLLEA